MIKKKRKKKIKLRHFLILLFLIYLSMIGANQNKLKKELKAKEKEVESEITVLQEDIEELNKQIEKRGTIEFLENTAREELGMVKPNEIIYIDRGKYKKSIFNFFNKSSD